MTTPRLEVSKDSLDWKRVSTWLDTEINRARTQLEAPGCTADQGNVLRGEIKLAKALLKAVDEPPPPLMAAARSYT